MRNLAICTRGLDKVIAIIIVLTDNVILSCGNNNIRIKIINYLKECFFDNTRRISIEILKLSDHLIQEVYVN